MPLPFTNSTKQISCWGQVFSGLSSRRCIAAGIINGTGNSIQVKSTKLVEGGSPCYSIPSKEFDPEQGVLKAGGAIIFFGWGVVPNLLQAGSVFMHVGKFIIEDLISVHFAIQRLTGISFHKIIPRNECVYQ